MRSHDQIRYGAILSSYSYQYDECNNLTKLTCSVAGSIWNTVYTYDNDNRPKTTTLANNTVITNTYDTIGRLANRKIGLNSDYVTTLTYVPGDGTNKTTGLVAAYQNGSDAAYSYEYDAVGNITEITQGTTSISYEYDVANRLTRENNGILNQTITYKYDKFGNIQNKKIYAYTTIGTDLLPTLTPIDTIGYTYNSTDWADQLVQYGNETISYDEMGNPTTYRGYTFGWRGKQLTSASNGTNSLTFEYNEDGLRQKKTVNNVDTDYFYNGSVLIGMQRGTSKFLFSYDASGNVVSVNYNGTEYYYLRNAQGDIVKIIDAAGEPVVQYTYDTWGKKVSTTGDLAGTLGLFQPFRYRGYVYDYETGFYYLQSRYYDPTTGRFISADVLLSTGQGVLGHNCYMYCLGNPVNGRDTLGSRPSFSVNMSDGGGSDNQYIYYDVPISDQDEESICWAFCQAMTEAFDNYEISSVNEINARAIQIAQEVFHSTDEKRWNRESYPHNKEFWPVYEIHITSITVLYNLLKENGPMYAYYKNGKDAHYVVVTGVDVKNNIVYTNNPWGYKGEQTFEDFLNGFYAGNGTNTEFHLRKLYFVKWKNRKFG